ncbi:MAG: 2-oxo acid dehydrogenase subunit E2 [Thermoleophilia bacterium]|jgi:pyruvate dehydrogenase E2 component (dihydrolipoamide acetyltransferase)|nr:2-oxo acid dehydrogenase subunit E2 [Thermoleophilia bacterium]
MRHRVAAATWRPARSGASYGLIDLDLAHAEPWLAGRAGVTLTHLVGAGVGRALAAVPEATARLVLGAPRRRPGSDLSFVVALGRGADMTACRVRDAGAKDPGMIARELYAAARAARRGADPQFGRAMAIAGRLPGPLVRPCLAAAGLVTCAIGVPFPPLGLDAHPFGAAMVTSVGMLGLRRGLAPLVPFARVGLVIVVGEAVTRPVVHEGRVVPGRVCELGVTVDHRLLDGAQMAELAAVLQSAVERPDLAWPEA